MARYFTNTEAFVDQDLSDMNKLRTYQPGEYWLIWADWTRKYEDCYPGWEGDDDSESSRKFWAEKSEEEFNARHADPNATMHIMQSTAREEDYNQDSAHRKSWREVFGVQEVADCDHCGELLTDKDRDNTDGHDTLGFFVKCDTCKKPLRLCEWCWDNSDDCCECKDRRDEEQWCVLCDMPLVNMTAEEQQRHRDSHK